MTQLYEAMLSFMYV